MEQLDQYAGISSITTGTNPFSAQSASSKEFGGARSRQTADNQSGASSRGLGARSALVAAIDAASAVTSISIAEATRQAIHDVQAQLTEVTDWLDAALQVAATSEMTRPPIVPRDYIAAFRKNLLAELARARGLAATDVVNLLLRVDEAGEGWKRTDRGKFISRLTGSDCADAVVAIAHDIRSPLCSILLLVDALRGREKVSADPIRERQLGLIYGAALGLSTTVSNLIDAARGSRLVTGKPAAFSITDTLMGVSAIVQPMCEEKGVPLELRFPRSDIRLGYASAIHQALLNLTANALRYTDAGAVCVGCNDVSPTRAEFWVSDTGPGIPDQVIEQLCYGFPPEGAPMRFSSAGLGLAIVRTLVEAMGSSLQVDTGPDGTHFSFVLELPPAR